MPLELHISELEPTQRVQVALERSAAGQRVKIVVESHDEGLGWYTSGSLTLPVHQLPLLEQAVAEMRRAPDDEEYGKIIPFPSVDLDISA